MNFLLTRIVRRCYC